MGVNLKLINYDQQIASLRYEPIILNDLPNVTEQDKQRIDRLTSTIYENVDVFSNEPSCECGKIRGGYNLHVMCKECNTPVLEPFEEGLENRVWIRAPKGVDALMNPIIWTMISEHFTVAGFNLLEWLCNTDYSPTINRPIKELQELQDMGFTRGYNNFVRNFDRVFEAMCKLKYFNKSKGYRKKNEQLSDLIRMYRECIFSKYLPLPNKALLILENTHSGRWIDPNVSVIVDAIRTITAIDTALTTLPVYKRENRAVKTIIKYADYCKEVYKTQIAKKTGIIRKNVLGTRVHFSTRAVISSNTGPHAYDEVWIAWGHGVTMLSLHLKNKLMNKHGFSPSEADAFLKEHTVKYHPLIDQLFKELIDESPDKGMWCVMVRNPSLSRASMQRMKITKVKTDVSDPTISLSILCVRGFNADERESLKPRTLFESKTMYCHV